MLRRFWHDRKGVISIETAFVLPVFLFLVFSGIEFGLVLYQRSVIESTVHDIARLALTGDTYGEDISRDEFLEELIDERINGALLTGGEFELETRFYDGLEELDGPGTVSQSSFGGRNQIVRYRISYVYDYLTPMGNLYADSTGQLTIQSTAFVKNERF